MLRFVRRDTRPLDAAAREAMRPYTGVLAELLYARGVDTSAAAELFLHPQLTALHAPQLLSDMQPALALLAQAKAEGWPVVVYGDYDCDGVCACALLTEALRLYGLTVTPHVPLRSEGYGLNIAAVESLSRQYRLLVTVDLGITNADEVARARELGMHVIVTDHHQPGLVPCPADAVINPLFAGYPFARLCGTGVAFKLAMALHGLETAMQWLDLAALATIADIVPLTDENRVIVAHGLPWIGKRPGLDALIAVAACRLPLTSETVAFQLAPRINAAGRIADANLGVRLLLTRDPAEAETLAKTLDAANVERKRLEAEATAEAAKQADEHDFVRRRVLFVRSQGWHAGVIGLVAGKLNTRFGVPVCALSEEDGVLHGSLRGVRGVNLAHCLQACDDLLLRYGGHEMAAGVTLTAENDEAFRARLERAVRLSAAEDVFVPAQEFDVPLDFADANDVLLDTLELLQPFGFGNLAPVFYAQGAMLERRRACGAQGAHLQLTLRQGDRSLAGIAFGMGAQASRLPDAVDVAFTLAREEYMGNVSIKCHVEAIRASAPALASAVAVEPEGTYHTAMVRLLLDALTAFPQPIAGNHAPDAEFYKAASCDVPEIAAAFARAASAGDTTVEAISAQAQKRTGTTRALTGDAAILDAAGTSAATALAAVQYANNHTIAATHKLSAADLATETLPTAQAELQQAGDGLPSEGTGTDAVAPQHKPTPLLADTLPTKDAYTDDPAPDWDGVTLPLTQLLQGRQGTLFVAYTRDTAAQFLRLYGTLVDGTQGAPDDARCFHTLLVKPRPQAVFGHWKAVVLLDGALCAQDIALWQQWLPGVRVYAPAPSAALQAQAAAIDIGDDRYRALYRLLRCSAFGSLTQTAAAAALGEAQTLVGLAVFQALSLITLTEVPFQYIVCEPRKCSLTDSPVLGALRALTVR